MEELGEKAKALLQSMALDAKTVERLGTTQAHMDAQGWDPTSWVELVSLLEYQDPELAQRAMPELLSLHLTLVSKATAHLALVLANVSRSTWTAAGMLSCDPHKAQTSALTLLQHLDTTRPTGHTQFERHLADTEVLFRNLQDFATRVPPVLLWQAQGAWKPLYQFMAMRFLMAPDQVLDCERVHARWQWLAEGKRRMQLPLMNSWLRTAQWLESAPGYSLPPPDVLQEHLEYAAARYAAAQKAIAGRDDVVPGMRQHVAPA